MFAQDMGQAALDPIVLRVIIKAACEVNEAVLLVEKAKNRRAAFADVFANERSSICGE
jgi:hypothetical protein